jgi:hypothetical protein
MTPEYSTLFLIRTPVMREAERDGAFFRGEICVKTPKAGPPGTYYNDIFWGEDGSSNLSMLGTVIGLVPLAIVGALSRFRARNSTSIQRGFTMSRLVVGIVLGAMLVGISSQSDEELQLDEENSKTMKGRLRILGGNLAFLLANGVCAIGGMVVVGLMIRDYGICTLID